MGEGPIDAVEARPLSRPDFVGRTTELDMFASALELACDPTSASVLLIGGDAGIGKSSVIVEAAERHDTRLLVANCVRVGSSQIPFAPLLTLLRRLNRSEPDVLSTAPLLARWIEPGSPLEVSSHDIMDATVELAASVADADGRMILAFEDLHWADAATWDLFGHLARNLAGHPVALVGTYRTIEVEADSTMRARLAELSRLPGSRRLVLHGWDADEVAERVESLLGEPAPPVLVAEIVSRAAGNPFFTEQLVAARRAGVAFPDVVADLIVADLDRLADPERAVVSALAVLGRPADEDLVCAVAGLSEDRASVLRGAVDSGLVVIDVDRYQLRHALIGEVAYRELLPGERRQRHRLAAEQLQVRAAASSGADRIGELAVHLDRAGDLERAFDALIVAGDAAEHIAPAAALEHLLRAIELWDDACAVSRHADLAQRLWQAADLASATQGNERAVELAERALTVGPPSRGWAWGHERLGRYLWASGRVDDSVGHFERARELIAGSHDSDGLAAVLAGLGQAGLMRGDYDAAESCTRQALDLLTDPDDDRLAWVMAQRVLGIVVSHRGAPDTGVEMCERAVAAAPSAHIRDLATVYLGLAHLAAGNFEAAATVALDGVADAQRAGTSRSFGGYFDALAAEALIRLGRWSDADRLLRRHRLGESLPIADSRLAVAAAKLAARIGDRDGARAHLAVAGEHEVDDWHGAFVTAGVADVELVLGNWASAAAAARRGLGTRLGPVLLWKARFIGLLVHAEVEAALDAVAARQPIDVGAVRSELEALLAEVSDDVGEHDESQLREVKAYLANAGATVGRLVGPDPDAWYGVAERWAALGDTWLSAIARLREAADAAATGQARRAEDALRAARAIAGELGSQPLLDEIADVASRARLRTDAPEIVVVSNTTAERLGLTAREAEVLGQLAMGATNREIGERLFISEKTASVHVSNILRKLGVTSRVEAAAVAQRLGLD